MVPRIHIAAFILIFTALLIFYFTYYHYMYLQSNELSFAVILASILAFVNPAEAPAELAFAPTGFHLTEHRAIKFWLLLSAVLLMCSFVLACMHRWLHGPSRFFVPIWFTSAVVFGAMVKVTYDMGLLNGT
tara:strand:- start:3301 stop:3693 length:393 start_codon:yes stop_codon:yes gene_type:complete